MDRYNFKDQVSHSISFSVDSHDPDILIFSLAISPPTVTSKGSSRSV